VEYFSDPVRLASRRIPGVRESPKLHPSFQKAVRRTYGVLHGVTASSPSESLIFSFLGITVTGNRFAREKGEPVSDNVQQEKKKSNDDNKLMKFIQNS